MSDPSPTTHRFNVSNNRRVPLRIRAAPMWVGIIIVAYVISYGNAIAAPMEYAVDGLAVGTQLNFGSASYREYKCSPSDQFDGLTWCQKTRSDKERRRPYTRPIHSCIRRTEIFYTSIVLNNQHFLIRRKPKPIYSDIRARLANRHA